MTNEELIAALRSQIGDDVSRVFDHEALFESSARAIERISVDYMLLAEKLVSVREKLADAQSALAYIAEVHGKLSGVGWDRVLPAPPQ